MFQSPGSIIFQLGPLPVRWYGLMIALGFLSATYFALRLAKRWGFDPDKIVNACLLGFLGGVIGARLYFVFLSIPYFAGHPLDIFQTWKGGLSIHGGLIGGILFSGLYCLKNKMPIATICDIAGASIPLGQAIGRWGNFFNSEAFGQPVSADYFLKLYIPPDKRPSLYQASDYFHPTFLYESLWDLAVFLLLYFYLAPKLKNFPGLTFCLYLVLYSIGRLCIEPLRLDSICAFGMPVPILASALTLVLALLSIVFLSIKYRSRKVS